jgi:glycosyltransferase involved in cell wall biosynthesis
MAALLALPISDRERMSSAARRAAVSRWSWSSIAERLLDVAVREHGPR